MSTLYTNYNPDILETIANLSNDEVFTPPKLANEVLDLLPEEVWSDSTITFLDPAVKTGIFLREIASRLIDGLAEEIPDLQERVNHILTKQVFGIGITELTTLMARRTVYCSTTANGEFSICTEFDDEKGNIIFPDTEHTWDKNGRCEYCGANESNYSGGADRENYAYPFIHDNFKKEFGNMKFDVIIGNPPYQLDMGNEGGNSSRASSLYHLFISKAIELNPKYISMIVPSRWMTKSAEGIPESWVDLMIKTNKLKYVYDFEDGDSLFRGSVGINGGVNYFLWDKDYDGKCDYFYHYADGEIISDSIYLNTHNLGIVIRDLKASSILKKVLAKSYGSFSDLVSPKNYFSNAELLTSSWRGYKEIKDRDSDIKYYVSKATNGVEFGWISVKDIPRNLEACELNKVYIPAANGTSSILGKPRFGEPKSVCSQTYLVIGYEHDLSKKQCLNIMEYVSTKFFRFLVKIIKPTQNGPRKFYRLVPTLDWNKTWTDKKLFEEFDLSDSEIDYIETVIPSMDISEELKAANNIAPMGDQDDQVYPDD